MRQLHPHVALAHMEAVGISGNIRRIRKGVAFVVQVILL